MSDKLIVVLGATGTQGGSVARLYSTLPGWRVRGITRDPTKPSCATLRDAGVELVAGDLNDQASLDRAFEGADAIFAVTDFWQFMSQPATIERAGKEGRAPNQVAFDLEVQQGKNIVDAAAKVATLSRLVISSLSDSEKWSGGKITWNYHFDSKARYCDYLKSSFPELAQKTSYVQIGYYLSNWNAFPFLAPAKEDDGSYLHIGINRPDSKHLTPYVDPPNDTGYFVKALVEYPQANQTLFGYSELMSGADYTALWGKTLGVKASFDGLELEGLTATGLPDFLAKELAESGAYCATWGWHGGDPEVKHPKELGVEVEKLTKVADWIKKEDWSGVL
ncbi:hypothetical protein LTR53_008315 [Teratosphaeriaceae sp. CCFEE 6253]|nr:hypothetical protein LTR53_008315 [Teratosphaeriaceae sp. CCFEE 6253]